MMVGLIVIGIFMGLDVANRSEANSRAKERATDLAQLDEDRMRGLQISDLESLKPSTRTVTIDNTTYTITSSVTFWSDSGSASCSLSGTGSADYLTTNSAVSWTGMTNSADTVRAESIVTPPVGGAIQAVVEDFSGNPLPNITVTLTGTGTATGTNATGTTDSNGCATFGGLALGPYTVTAGDNTYVDQSGNSPPVQYTSAIAGETNKAPFAIGKPGAVSATFSTTYGGSSHASTADSIVAYRTCGTCTAQVFPQGSFVSTANSTMTLFPASGYAVYAGTCTSDAPTANGQSSNGAGVTVVGSTTTSAGTIQLPSLLITPVVDSYTISGWWPFQSRTDHWANATSRADVTITDNNCGGTVRLGPNNGSTNATTANPSTAASGALTDPGTPYGQYTICVDEPNPEYGSNGDNNHYVKATETLNINSPTPATQVMDLGPYENQSGVTGANGSC
jgi:hypothetical protein